MAAEQAAKAAMEHGLKVVEVFVKGPQVVFAIRSLQAAGLEVNAIKDVTPIHIMAAVRQTWKSIITGGAVTMSMCRFNQ